MSGAPSAAALAAAGAGGQTRRRLRGRQPLCGIGVTSRIDVIVKPTLCKDLSADSRPEPGPRTSTSRVRMPCSMALRPACSAATCAANGVDLREPLKPWLPADDQAIALPCASVMVIIVLLNDALTWATPDEMFLRSRRRRRGLVSLAIGYFLTFFLPAIGRDGPLRVRALVWVRCPCTGNPLRCRSPR